jgi:hypothetical protein
MIDPQIHGIHGIWNFGFEVRESREFVDRDIPGIRSSSHESDMFHLVVPFGIHDFVSRLGVGARMAPVAEAQAEEQGANGEQQAAENG